MAPPACPVCGQSDPSRVRTLVVENREIVLCDTHAGIVVRARPTTFEALRALFRMRPEPQTEPDRRSPIDRRGEARSDRRVFPRPEGRRMGYGRRATDPRD
ncbi:MAG: hypothetical protein ACOC1F_02800 [Myxococcota bacterium]